MPIPAYLWFIQNDFENLWDKKVFTESKQKIYKLQNIYR